MLEFFLAKKKKTGAVPFIGSSFFDGVSSAPVTMPAGVVAGDFLLLFADAVGVVTAPSGWTTFSSTGWSYSYNRKLMYKIAGASEANFTLGQSGAYEIIGSLLAYRGPTQVVTYSNQESKTTYTYPSLTATSDGSILITHANDRSPSIPTVPAGETSRASRFGSYFGFRTSDETVNSGATGTRTSSGASSYNGYYSGILIA
jgi:hypothetical protein